MKEAVIASQEYNNSRILYSNRYEPFLPFYLYYTRYKSPNSAPISQQITTFSNNYFSGTSINEKVSFGNFEWDKVTNNDNIFVVPKSEYQNIVNKTQFEIIKTITKKYINSEEFYILKTNSDTPKIK
jgi:hypothetical protein